MVKLLEKLVQPAKPSNSVMPVELQNSGALRVDVGGFLSSKEGKEELEKAQEHWEQQEQKLAKTA